MTDMQRTVGGAFGRQMTAEESRDWQAEYQKQMAEQQQYRQLHNAWTQQREEATLRHRAREHALACAAAAMAGAVDPGLVLSAASDMESWLLETAIAVSAANQPPQYPDALLQPMGMQAGVVLGRLGDQVPDTIARSLDRSPW